MKKNYWLIGLSLLCSLLIYLFYRTEKTVINQIFISIVSLDRFVEWRKHVTSALPLNEHIIYSLPEGLWVFCITLTSKSLFVIIYSRKINLLFLPLIFSIGLEIFQLFHFTHGRFDFWDIGSSVAGWAAAWLINNKSAKQNIVHPFTARSFTCVLSYLVVYLAHVWQ
jgi:hypothetical protein